MEIQKRISAKIAGDWRFHTLNKKFAAYLPPPPSAVAQLIDTWGTSLDITYFSVAVIEHPDKGNFRKIRFILSHSSQGDAVYHEGKTWHQHYEINQSHFISTQKAASEQEVEPR